MKSQFQQALMNAVVLVVLFIAFAWVSNDDYEHDVAQDIAVKRYCKEVDNGTHKDYAHMYRDYCGGKNPPKFI